MNIRDVLHGSILIESGELPIIDSRYFQRLRQIKQLGFAEHSFPSATHNRYVHSLGAMHTAGVVLKSVFGDSRGPHLAPEVHARLRAVTRLAALLHDIGHGPLSHTTEFAMPEVSELRLPAGITDGKPRQATHEDYTLKIVLDSGLTPLLERTGQPHGMRPIHVAALIDSKLPLSATDADFFMGEFEGERVDFRPLLSQLISSEMDADRMDYLRRDSLHCGVSYGQFDFDWLAENLTFHVDQGRAYLTLQHRALYSFEDFLISRFHMFLMVYFHYKSVVYDAMLAQYFASPDCDYALPADIERYADCDDAHLYAHLSHSSNEWARRIVERRPFRMLIELHSGIPATKTAAEEQRQLLQEVEADLARGDVFFLRQTSTGELSKYFRKPGHPIFVRYDNHYNRPSIIPLEQCTDLFSRYGEKRTITRLYISPENFSARRGRAPSAHDEDPLARRGRPSSDSV